MIFRNPFQPFLAVDNDDEPVRSRQAGVFNPFARATKALETAELDLETARQRAADADRKKRRHAQLEQEATMAERSRILTILTSPVAARHPRLAERVALESDSPAREAIEALEQYERDNAARNAKAVAAQIVRAGEIRRGLADAPITAGPKKFVKATSEDILAAARRARGEA